jgi:hypothetical protein
MMLETMPGLLPCLHESRNRAEERHVELPLHTSEVLSFRSNSSRAVAATPPVEPVHT